MQRFLARRVFPAVVALVALLAFTNSASAEIDRPDVPGLEVPDDQALLFRGFAVGVQIYDCNATTSAWTFRAPRADLYDEDGNRFISHFGGIDVGLTPGPYWQGDDGSGVRGSANASVASSNDDSIPNLRLSVVERLGDGGQFGWVNWVQRLDSSGGLAPNQGQCDPENDTVYESPYSATYYFYGD